MRHNEGLTLDEVELLCDILQLGPAYVNSYAQFHLVGTAVSNSPACEQLVFPTQVLFVESTTDGVRSLNPLGASNSNYNNNHKPPSRHVNRDSTAIRNIDPRVNTSRPSTANSTHSEDDSSQASSTGMDLMTANDPGAIKKIQAGNRLVQRTWNEAYATPKFTERLLERQRALNPELSDSVFYKINQSKLADKLGAMINESIQMLDKPDAFIPVMMQLGVKHIMYGVGDEHLDMFRDALFILLKELLQPPRTQWTDELGKEWRRAFTLMKSMMTQGRVTPQGLKESRRYNAQTHRMLLRCWQSVKDREDTGVETSFVELLHTEGGKVISADRYDLFANLVARRRMFMEMMSKLFEVGLADSEATHLLRELGARHVSYGLTKEDYDAYTEPFIETVSLCARPSTMNPLVKHLLRNFWKRATKTMLEGSVESRCAFALRQAPKGSPFAILFTDIEASTSLWETQPVAMEKAVDEHHKLMRDLIHDHNGYEVKTIGDSFMVVFKRPHRCRHDGPASAGRATSSDNGWAFGGPHQVRGVGSQPPVEQLCRSRSCGRTLVH